METAEALPPGALDVTDLRPVVEGIGPFLSVVLTTDAHAENAAQRSDARWRSLRSDASSLGVPDDVLLRIDPLIPDAHLQGEAVSIIATREGLAHIEYGPTPAADDIRWSGIPHLLPILAWRQAVPPYLVVLTDRTGADLHAIRHGAPDVERQVSGDHDEIRKVAPGGWSQQRYQARAEDSWQHNAQEVAEAVASLAQRIEPHVILVAGDVRAVTMLGERLPEQVRSVVRLIDGERPWDGSHANLPPELQDVVDASVRDETDRLLERLAEELGQHDKAVTGLGGVVAALSRAQVAVLLLPERGSDRELSFGRDPTLLSTSRDDLIGMGIDDPHQAPAEDVLLRAAIATGAQVRILPAPKEPAGRGDLAAEESPRDARLKDGVGALLRWA